ncbi:hypothetical protein [Deinococcus aquatilis]|jgi:hypothetical protein|uniref:hypothetical protein n=1 Tax=Deinococcus aquatilis TaxID=519440 RepID=UPI00039DB2A4|nr:hypothetical protein [Deinococcus aquatilis]
MSESVSSGLARLHVLLDPTLPAYQQWPTEALIWTRASQWASCTETGNTPIGRTETGSTETEMKRRQEARSLRSDLAPTPR